MEVKEAVTKKIAEYKKSSGIVGWEKGAIGNECRRLEKKLGIPKVEPKEYRLLKRISEEAKIGKELDLAALARWAGYPVWKCKRPETSIMRNIDDKLFNELVGLNRNEIQLELLKIMKQDEDLSAKNKAIDLASKIVGMSEPDKGTQVNIVAGGIKIDK